MPKNYFTEREAFFTKKQAVSWLLVVVMMMGFCVAGGGTVFAATDTSGQCGDDMEWMFNSSTGVLSISGSGEMTSAPWRSSFYTPPIKTIKFYGSITSIYPEAFRGTPVESVVIPNSVETIGGKAFYQCKSLSSLTLGSHVKEINNTAFGDCVLLDKIVIPNSVEYIGKWAFSGCKATAVTFGSAPALKTVEQEAFSECAFPSFTLPDTVETLGTGVFMDCTNLRTVSFGANPKITTLPASTFRNAGLTSITLPDGIQTIGTSAFSQCEKLTNITFGSGLKTIQSYAFYHSSIAEMTLPDSLEVIEQYAFYQTKTKRVTFGSGLKRIGKYAFQAGALTEVHIPDSVEDIGDWAFYNNSQLKTVTFGKNSHLTAIGNAFEKCTALESVTFGDQLETLGQYAFRGCTSLKTVALGSSLRTIGTDAFSGCTNLTGLTMPRTITTIATSFGGNSRLQAMAIDVNAPLTALPAGFLQGCSQLTSFTIPNNVPNIGTFTFADCTALKTVTIGRNVGKIGSSAFANCTALTKVSYMGSEADWTELCKHIASGNEALLNASVTFAQTSPGNGDTPTSLSVRRLPDKTTYYVGDTLDTTGLALTLNYANGATKQTAADFTCTPTSLTAAGTQKITVSCNGLTTAFSVTVAEKPQILAQPFDVIGQNGDPVTFTVKASGTGLSYQWQVGHYAGDEGDYWIDLPSNTNICTTYFRDSNSYGEYYIRCVITDQYGTKLETRSAMMYKEIPVTMSPYYGVSGKAGETFTFRCRATLYSDTISYQWQTSNDQGKTWQNAANDKISSEIVSQWITGSRYCDTILPNMDGRLVRCIVSDDKGHTATSREVSIDVKAPTPLTITTQPASVTVQKGATACFKVTATGDGLTYQWQLRDDSGKTWRNSKATSANYSAAVTNANNGRYVRCIVTDIYGHSVTSNAASMKMAAALKITSQPASVTVQKGATAYFKVTATGDGLTYQWQLSDDNGKTWRNSKATNANYSAAVTDANNGRYVRCIVTDKYGNKATSNAASMKMAAAALKITTQPASVTVQKGATAYFKVTATGDGLTYQWQLSDDNGKTWRNSKATNANYSAAVTDANNGRYVRCIVTDKYGNSVTSNAASMKMSAAALKITTQPTSVMVQKGATAYFKVTATGDGLTYQWQLSDDNGKTWRNSKATNANYSAAVTDANNGRYVRCIVTDKYGNQITSNAASMKIK